MNEGDDRPDLQSLEPAIERARPVLAEADPAQVGQRAGCALDCRSQTLTVPFMGNTYLITLAGSQVLDADGSPAPKFVSDLLLLYLARADGTAVGGGWKAFRELPDGMFYHQAFQSYSGQSLVRAFGSDLDAFASAAAAVGGQPEAIGDVGFRFVVLPRVLLAVAYWAGDDELPPNAEVLFDRAADHYLPPDALAIVGGWLARHIIKRRP